MVAIGQGRGNRFGTSARVWLAGRTRRRYCQAACGVVLLSVALITCFVTPASALVSTGNGAWFWQNPLPQGNSLNGVSFVDASHGWAVGAAGTIIATSDGGTTWNGQSWSTSTLNGLDFVDASHGWAVGDSGTILATSDGGATWSAQVSGTSADLFGIAFTDASHGWAVGDSGTILVTNNAGATWSPQVSGTSAELNGVAFTDTSHGCAVGYRTILVTDDGGATWTAQSSGANEELRAVAFTDASHGWVVGDEGILATDNGGATWSHQTGGGAERLSDVAFTDSSHGCAVGYDLEGWGFSKSVVLTTSNGGVTWSSRNVGTSVPLLAVSCGDASHAVAVGVGVIFATDNGGDTWSRPSFAAGGDPEGAGSNVGLEDVSFPDASHGWAVGWDGLTQESVILATSDTGATWVSQASGAANDLHDVAFTDTSHGWSVGDSGTILVTSSGGATWNTQVSGTLDDLRGVAFTDASHGWAVGGPRIWDYPETGIVLATGDGGATWHAQNEDAAAELNAVAFADASHGWAVGDNGTIIATIDGGAHWNVQVSGTTAGLTGVDFVDAQHGWVVGCLARGEEGPGPGVILATSDGGASWRLQCSSADLPLQGVAFTDASHGLATRWDEQALVSDILATSNGGASWHEQAASIPQYLAAFAFTDISHCWAVGGNDAILATTTGGESTGGSHATASLTGTVTNAAGTTPLPGITVSVQRLSAPMLTFSVTTGTNGTFIESGLSAGSYKVSFTDRNGDYLPGYYNNKASASSADVVTLSDGQALSGIDAHLANAGRISGTVRKLGGAPFAGVEVDVWGSDDIVGSCTTAADGTYNIGGLVAGTFDLVFIPPDMTYASQEVDNVHVPAGQHVSGMNATLQQFGSITGKVTDVHGAALANARVSAYKSSGTWVEEAESASDGTFSLDGLAPGSYKVGFVLDADVTHYCPCYFNTKDTLAAADVVTVLSGQTTTGINGQMLEGGNIQGTVSGTGNVDREDIQVTVYDSTGRVVDSTWVFPDGTYYVDGLKGVYKVRFTDSTGVLASQWYNGKSSIQTATPLTVAAGSATLHVDADFGIKDLDAPTTAAVGLAADDHSGWGRYKSVTLEANDTGGSGLAATYYTIDGIQSTYDAWDEIGVSAAGSHIITYWSVDNAGNVESPHTGYVNIDLTPPVTTADGLQADDHSGWINHAQSVKLSASDGNGAGVRCIYYVIIDSSGFETYGAPFSISTSGSHQVVYWSEDACGNEEEPSRTGYVNIDTAPPALAITSPAEGGSYASGLWALDFTKSDALSGLDAAREAIALDGSPATAAQVANAPAGAHTLVITEYDLAGNATTITRHFSTVASPTPSISAPTGGSFTQGGASSVSFSLSGAVSSGSFRVWLKNTATNAWVRITPAASPIAAVPGQSSYSAPWPITQDPADYKLWVYYYAPDGSVLGTGVSSGTITILPATPTPTITSPNSGSFFPGSAQSVSWKMSSAVSVGSFRVWLKNTATNAWLRITPSASPIAAVPGKTSYSVPWSVTQDSGAYKLWVYYYGPDGATVLGAAASSGTITILPQPSISSPNSGSFAPGSAQAISWVMNGAVSSGSFRLWLKDTTSGAWVRITPAASPLPALSGQSSYSVPWTVGQPVGAYKLWVYYYGPDGVTVLASTCSSGTVTILLKPTPTISSPNSGSFLRSTSTTVGWSMSSAVSEGSFRVWLKDSTTNAWVRITPAASPVAAVPGQTIYTVPWLITQAVGSYKLWVYYYTADGTTVLGTAVSSGSISVI